MGDKVTEWVTSQAADARYVEVPARAVREEPIVISIDADKGEVSDAGVMVARGQGHHRRLRHRDRREGHDLGLPSARDRRGGSRVSIVEVIGATDAQQHLESVGIARRRRPHRRRQYALGGGTVAMGLRRPQRDAPDRPQPRYFANGNEVLDINHVVQRGRHPCAGPSPACSTAPPGRACAPRSTSCTVGAAPRAARPRACS